MELKENAEKVKLALRYGDKYFDDGEIVKITNADGKVTIGTLYISVRKNSIHFAIDDGAWAIPVEYEKILSLEKASEEEKAVYRSNYRTLQGTFSYLDLGGGVLKL